MPLAIKSVGIAPRTVAAARPVRAARMVRARADPREAKVMEEAMKRVQTLTKEGADKKAIAEAYDEVEEIAAAVSHKKAQGPEDPLETFCKDDPSADECRVYE